MFFGRHLLEIAILAVPLALVGVGCGDVNLSASIAGQRAEIDFQSDYRLASEQAHRTGKPLLIVIKTEWCPFSRELLNETFTSREVVGACEQFVCVLLDAEQQPKLCHRLNTSAVYPTTQLVSPQQVVLARIEGSRTPQELLAEMRKVLQ